MDRIQYQRFAKIDDCHWWFEARRQIVSRLLKVMLGNKTGSRQILDIGTGTGGMLPVLAGWGQVTALEPDLQTLQFTSKRLEHLGQRVSFVQTGWENANLPRSGFDVITAFDVLEHCADDRQAIEQWRTWLKEDGLLFLTVPAFPCLWGLNDEISHHYRRYTRATLLNVLHEADFVVDKISYMNAAMFLPVWVSRNIKERWQRYFSRDKMIVPWDFGMPPAMLNALLQRVFSWEKVWLSRGELPWGTSLVAVARPQEHVVK